MEEQGLVLSPMPNYSQTPRKGRRYLMQVKVIATVEESHISRVTVMRHRGAWMRWEGVMERRLTWSDIWQAELQCMKFLIQAICDALQMPYLCQLLVDLEKQLKLPAHIAEISLQP